MSLCSSATAPAMAINAVLAFDIHERKACGVPEFVAEVSVALAALDVKVHVAAERGVGSHRKAQGIGAERGNAVRVALSEALFNLRGFFGLTQTAGVLLYERLKVNAGNKIERIERVAFALTHLLAFGITHETVDVDVLKGSAAREVFGHHDHARNPEENDVVSSYKYIRWIEVVKILRLMWPAKG